MKLFHWSILSDTYLKASALVVLSVLSKANSANWVFIPVLYYLCGLGLIFVFFPFVNHFAILLLPNTFAHEDILPVLHIIADAVCILMQKSTSECFLCCSVLLAVCAHLSFRFSILWRIFCVPQWQAFPRLVLVYYFHAVMHHQYGTTTIRPLFCYNLDCD